MGGEFYLHHGFGSDQGRNLYHGGGGLNLSEKLPMGMPHLLPSGNIGHVDPGSNHIFQAASCLFQNPFCDPDNFNGLLVRIINSCGITLRIEGNRTRNLDQMS
jgi:hypothetical protein